MRKEGLKGLSREQLEQLICEWVVKYHDLKDELNNCSRDRKYEKEVFEKECELLSDRALKVEQECSRLEEMLKTSSELIELLKKELEEHETLEIIASEYKTERERWCSGQSNADRLIAKLHDQCRQDCIRYNDMRTAYLVTLDELGRLRELFGAGR